MSDDSLPLPVEKVDKHWAKTPTWKRNIHYTWTINNFSLRNPNVGAKVVSPCFYSSEDYDNIQWGLKIFPNGCDAQSRGFLSLYIYLISAPYDGSEVIAKCKMYIINDKRDDAASCELKKMSEPQVFTRSQNYFGYSKYIERSILMDETSGLLPEDKLIIVCEISFASNIPDESSCCLVLMREFKIPIYNVSDELRILLDNPKCSDVTLVVGEHKFPAHKVILALQSDVFAAMFEHDMAERKSGQVIITDVNWEVLQEVLRFIYTDDAPKIKELANQLLAAADKYALKKLKILAEKAIFAELSIENAAETLLLADLHNAHQLRVHTIKFIKVHSKDIIKTDG